MVSPLDLTTIDSVRAFLAPMSPSQQEQTLIQQMITGASVYFLQRTSRGHADVQIPAQSPFVQPVSYSDVYDGSITNRLFPKDYPIISVESLVIGTVTVPQSTSFGQWGWVIDSTGRSLSIRPGGGSVPPSRPLTVGFNSLYPSTRGMFGGATTQSVAIQYTAGYNLRPVTDELQVVPGDPYLIGTINPWVSDVGVRYFSNGNPFTRVMVAPSAPGQYYVTNQNQYLFFHADAGQSVLISYNSPGTPADIVEKMTKLVAINYKRRGWLDQSSQMMTGPAGGTVSYRDWETSPDIERVINYYSRYSRS